MAVAEAITNIVWAKVSSIEDIRCSGNWMWPAKLPGEGAALYDAAAAMTEIMLELGIAVDGGKDSISMAAVVAKCGTEKGTVPDLRTTQSGVVESGLSRYTEIVKAPGSLVISAYATCPDITKVITPDIKRPGQSRLLYIDLARGKRGLRLSWQVTDINSAMRHLILKMPDYLSGHSLLYRRLLTRTSFSQGTT